eukprot:gene19816-biopygen20555
MWRLFEEKISLPTSTGKPAGVIMSSTSRLQRKKEFTPSPSEGKVLHLDKAPERQPWKNPCFRRAARARGGGRWDR